MSEDQWNMDGLPVVEEETEEAQKEVQDQELEKEQEEEHEQEEMKGMSAAEAVPDHPNSSGGEEEEVQQVEPEVVADTTEPEPEPETPKQRPIKKAQRTKKINVSVTKNAASKPKPKPVKLPPTKTEDDDEDEEDECEEEVSDDTARVVIQNVMRVAERVLSLVLCGVMCTGRLLCGTFSLLRRGVGILFGAALFAGVTYIIGTYALSPVTKHDVPDFEARLRFLLRCQVWPTLSVFLAALAGTFRKDSEVHAGFAREVFEHALLTLFNFLLLATHINTENLVWVDACTVTATIFSLLHWMCLVYTKRSGSVFALPGTLLNFSLMAYNIYVIFAQDLGYVTATTEAEVTSRSGGSQGRPTYWDHLTMCYMVDRMFCQP